jgi:hypothetical protein
MLAVAATAKCEYFKSVDRSLANPRHEVHGHRKSWENLWGNHGEAKFLFPYHEVMKLRVHVL